jgi:hypothetical protein
MRRTAGHQPGRRARPSTAVDRLRRSTTPLRAGGPHWSMLKHGAERSADALGSEPRTPRVVVGAWVSRCLELEGVEWDYLNLTFKIASSWKVSYPTADSRKGEILFQHGSSVTARRRADPPSHLCITTRITFRGEGWASHHRCFEATAAGVSAQPGVWLRRYPVRRRAVVELRGRR